jgi:rhodanese-related sulfurtransferase
MIETIFPDELKTRLNKGEQLQLIDVREVDEVAQGIIPGAKHIPLGELPSRHGEIDRNGEIILVCRSGNRSRKAYEYLQTLGFQGLKNMHGGMLEWDKQ